MVKRTRNLNRTPHGGEWVDQTALRALDQEPTDDPGPTVIPDDDRGPTTVYFLHDADHQLLYVGITLSARGLARMSDHAGSKHWWTDVAYSSMKHFPSRIEAEICEAKAIEKLGPRYNVAHPSVAVSPGGIRLCGCGCRRPVEPGKGSVRVACRQRMYRARKAAREAS